MHDEPARAIGIRHATDADLLSIVDIMNREIHESPFVWGEVPHTVDGRREWLNAHRQANQPVLVACDSAGEVIGWASLSTFRSSSGYRYTCEVSVYVARDAQRRGVGRQLVETLHASARAAGLHALVAVIDAEHVASIQLFTSFGYAERGRLEELGRKFGQWRSEVFMLKHL